MYVENTVRIRTMKEVACLLCQEEDHWAGNKDDRTSAPRFMFRCQTLLVNKLDSYLKHYLSLLEIMDGAEFIVRSKSRMNATHSSINFHSKHVIL